MLPGVELIAFGSLLGFHPVRKFKSVHIEWDSS